jgi:oligopeptide transport system substrate-binding protein
MPRQSPQQSLARRAGFVAGCGAVFRRFLFPLLAAVALAGCGRPMDRADLVFINGAEPEVLDPAGMTAQATGRVAYAVYEGLMAWTADGKPGFGVAERYDLSPDKREYTFHLRANAVWTNGDPVTAHHFAYAWRRTLLPETAAEYASQLYPVRNAKAFNQGKLTDFSQVGIEVVGERTLKVTLEAPTAYFLDLCCFSTLLPVHPPTVEKYSDWSSNPAHFTGNGAFILKEWRVFDRVRLVKNPRYWDAASVKMESVDVLPAAKPMTAFNLYATGEADLMLDKGLAPTELISELRKRPDFHSPPFLGSYFFRYNVTRKPFDDVRVRLAISMVVDQWLITEKITRAGEPPAYSITPPGTGTGYQPPPGLKRDAERARQLLAEAGYPGGKGMRPVYYLYKGDSDLDRYIGVELQGMFARELGVRMELQAQEWNAFLDAQSRLDYDLARSAWVADYNDPNTFLGMFVTGDGNNRTGWSNARYDELIAGAAREGDQAKRYAMFQEAEKILISQEGPICPLFHYVGIEFFDGEKLGGVVPNLLDEHGLKHMYWKKPR